MYAGMNIFSCFEEQPKIKLSKKGHMKLGRYPPKS